MSRSERIPFTGPILLSHGFRLFFFLALLFAMTVIPYWLAVFLGLVEISGPFGPVDWHIHEMIFGYAAAVIAGFLFTAIPNWTGRLPIKGLPLAVLACLWLAGRCVLLGVGGFGPVVILLVDSSFLAAVLCAAMIEILAGKNWRNLMVVLPVGLFLGANILFHLEVMTTGSADLGRRLGLAVVVFLITLIGGRVIPSFTRNWLVKQGAKHLPIPFNRFDGLCLLGGAVALLVWVAVPDRPESGVMLLAAALLHIFRLSRWQTLQTLASPLLFILHFSYAFVPLGLGVIGLGFDAQGVHILGIGAIASMTIAVMIRASAGHTGRKLEMNRWLVLGFALLPVSAILRALAPMADLYYPHVLICAGALWAIGFWVVFVQIGPWLWSANSKKRSANPR